MESTNMTTVEVWISLLYLKMIIM